MRTYSQFCPIAKAAEILAERWTLLIVRELLFGARRFSEIERGVPRIPHSLLVDRLRTLQRAGVVETHARASGRGVDYSLTLAGQELLPIVMQLGEWGQRWANADVNDSDLDPALLMWDMRRRLDPARMPDRRLVIQVDFRGARAERWWVLRDRDEISVCHDDFGFEADLFLTADTVALHRVWVGRLTLADAIREGLIELDGLSDLVQAFPQWLVLSPLAGIAPAAPAVAPLTVEEMNHGRTH